MGNKWKKKDVLEKLEEKKSGAQARAMARGLSRAERRITRRNEELKKAEQSTAEAKAALEAKSKLLRAYKRAMRAKLRKIKKVLWAKAQGNNKVWLKKALKKCHASEVGLHNKWVKCTHKSKMSLELCRRAGKVALAMEKNRCARMSTRSALAKRAGKVALNMCISKKKMYKEQAENCSPARR